MRMFSQESSQIISHLLQSTKPTSIFEIFLSLVRMHSKTGFYQYAMYVEDICTYIKQNKLSVDIQVTQREGTIFQCLLSYTFYYKNPTHLISLNSFP